MKIVGVRFQRLGKVHYFDPADLDLKVDDKVMVKVDQGTQMAQVIIAPEQVLYSEVRGPLEPVLEKLPAEEPSQRSDQ